MQDFRFTSRILNRLITVTWKIENFSTEPTREGGYVRSPSFGCEHTTWVLDIYPRGKKTKCIGHVGIHLRVMARKDYITKCAFYKIGIVDRKGEHRYVIDSFTTPENGDIVWPLIDRHELLELEHHELLPADVLTVYCELLLTRCIHGLEDTKDLNLEMHHDSPCLSGLSKDLQNLYENPRFSDVTLRVDGAPDYPAHRAILSARSSVFTRMLSSESSIKVIHIQDLQPSTLINMLRYIYTGNMQRQSDLSHVLELYTAASKYDIQGLKKRCTKLIFEWISIDTICELAVFADLHNDKELKEAVKNFFNRNAAVIIHSNEWKNLLQDRPILCSELMETVLHSVKLTFSYSNKQ